MINKNYLSKFQKKNNEEDNGVFQFLLPFSIRVWGYIVCAVIVVGMFLHLLNRFGAFGSYKHDADESRGYEFNMGNSLWFALGTFVQQGNIF